MTDTALTRRKKQQDALIEQKRRELHESELATTRLLEAVAGNIGQQTSGGPDDDAVLARQMQADEYMRPSQQDRIAQTSGSEICLPQIPSPRSSRGSPRNSSQSPSSISNHPNYQSL
eukprot:gene3342-3839_t